jgi:hypothetical protein
VIMRYGAALLGLFAAATSGCGGTDEGRPTSVPEAQLAPDYGSKPILCGVTDDYEFSMLQDFETDSVTGGWYFNNDHCDKCQKVIDRIKEIINLRKNSAIESSAISISHPDKHGCNDWRLLPDPDQDPEATSKLEAQANAEYDAELELLAKKLIDGDPDNNVPPNCRAVCEASQTPSAYIKPLSASRIEFSKNGELTAEPRCGSRFAMHVVGGPFQVWGGVVAVQLGHPGLDATGWDGISFWARVGPSSRHPLRIEISDERTDDKQMVYTFPGTTQPVLVTADDLYERNDQGDVIGSGHFDTRGDPESWCNNVQFVCNADSVREDKNGCDKFGANRTMTGDWQFYTVDFLSARQSGWGMPAHDPLGPNGNPVPLDSSQLRSLNFMWTTGIWDVWIDDVALYRRKQP